MHVNKVVWSGNGPVDKQFLNRQRNYELRIVWPNHSERRGNRYDNKLSISYREHEKIALLHGKKNIYKLIKIAKKVSSTDNEGVPTNKSLANNIPSVK